MVCTPIITVFYTAGKNPFIFLEQEHGSTKVKVCCAVSINGIIGQYYFVHDMGNSHMGKIYILNFLCYLKISLHVHELDGSLICL